jgi:DHA1 family bicyclomycin/chloramphenicol resistance-like MFS transporter
VQNKLAYAVVLGAVFMLSPFAIDMYLPALPTIAESLQTGIDGLEATVAIYLFGFALGQLILGPVSDAFGRRIILISGLAVFIVASAMAGTVDTLDQLYAWRFVQGLGSAGSVTVFPMVRARFGQAGSAQVISYIMAITVVAPLVAPIIGGYVLTFAGWEAIFFVLAALGALAFVASGTFVRETHERRRPFSLRRIAQGYAVTLSERRIVAAIFAGGFAFAGLFAFVAGSPFVYIVYFGVAPEYYGYLVGLNALSMIGANLINAQLLINAAPVAKLYAGALLLAASGLAILAVALLDLGLVPLVVAVVVFVGALGMTATNAIVAALSVLPEENGTVAALNGALQFAIGALSSLLVSVMASTNAVPMALVMAGCGIVALVSAIILKTSPVKSRPADTNPVSNGASHA